jgi:hypothetical protein
MCRGLDVHRSGFYAWLLEPLSPRTMENQALTAQIKEFYEQSMGIYGSPRIFCNLKEAGVACSENRVARGVYGETSNCVMKSVYKIGGMPHQIIGRRRIGR